MSSASITKADALRIAKEECARRDWPWNEHTTARWGISITPCGVEVEREEICV